MINLNKPVLVHCFVAGRSGTALAGYLIYKGMNHSDALSEMAKKLSETVVRDSQMNVLVEYEKIIKKNRRREGILNV